MAKNRTLYCTVEVRNGAGVPHFVSTPYTDKMAAIDDLVDSAFESGYQGHESKGELWKHIVTWGHYTDGGTTYSVIEMGA
jgi:hypothetical protein